MLRLLGDMQIEITKSSEKEFLVVPKNLKKTIFTFVLTTRKRNGILDISDFRVFNFRHITGHQSNYVPVNSGIEIYFI